MDQQSTDAAGNGKKSMLLLPGWAANGLIFLGVALVVFAIAGIILTGQSEPKTGAVQPPRVGEPLRDFSLQDLSGKTVKLSDYAGQPVLINTWATWCPPCRVEMPALQAFYDAHQGSGFVLLAVNVGESKAQAGTFAREFNLTFPILLDSDQKLADSMMIHDFPTSILIGKDGKVKRIHVGMISAEQLDAEMLPLIQ